MRPSDFWDLKLATPFQMWKSQLQPSTQLSQWCPSVSLRCLCLSLRPASSPLSFYDMFSSDNKENIHFSDSVNEDTQKEYVSMSCHILPMWFCKIRVVPVRWHPLLRMGTAWWRACKANYVIPSNHKAPAGRPFIVTGNEMIFAILMDLTSEYSSLGKGQQYKKEYRDLPSIGLKIYLERQITWNHRTEMCSQG